MMHPDEHVPDTYRPQPSDFSGPICAECMHSRVGWHPDGRAPGPRDFYCVAFTPKVLRPAQRCPITGDHQEALVEHARCHEKNGDGQCDRFIIKPAGAELTPAPEGQLAKRRHQIRRDMLLVIGLAVIAWFATWGLGVLLRGGV